MLIWTASTRSAVVQKANDIKFNHKTVVEFINNEVNECGNADESKVTIWGDPCNGEWIAEKVVSYINNNLQNHHAMRLYHCEALYDRTILYLF